MEPLGWASNAEVEPSNDPTERRLHSRWRTPRKTRHQQQEEVIELKNFESLCGSPNNANDDIIRLTPATAVATPFTITSEGFSPSPDNDNNHSNIIIPRPSFRLYEDDDGHSMQWSLEPGNLISRPTSTTPTVTAVPISPDRISMNSVSSFSPSPIRSPRPPPPDLSLFNEDDSIIMWSENPEKHYFEYMLRMEQEHRARQGKPAEDSLLGNSTIEEMIQAGPLAVLQVGSNQSQANRSSTLAGFSLATTEKSAPVSIQARSLSAKSSMHPSTISSKSPWQKRTTAQMQQAQDASVPLHKQGSEHFGRVLPDVIYVLDRTSNTTTICTSKASCDLRRGAPNKILFFAITFTLCGIMLAGAAVAIYFSQFFAKKNNDGGSTNQVIFGEESQSPLAVVAPTEYPTISPSKNLIVAPPSTLKETKKPSSDFLPLTANPTVDELYWDVYWGTDAPTGKGTAVPSPVYNNREESGTLSQQPSLKPSHASSAPTQTQSQEPTVSTLEPSNGPTQIPSISALEPTFAPTQILSLSTLDPTHHPTDFPSTGTPPSTPGAKCGCKYCVNLLEAMADGYTCSDRIYFLRVEWGMSERQACYTVAGYEYPQECSGALCDPTKCVLIDEGGAMSAPPKPQTTTASLNSKQPTAFPISNATQTTASLTSKQPTAFPVSNAAQTTASLTSKQPTAFPISNAATIPPVRPTMQPTLRPTKHPSRAPTPSPTISPVPTSTPTQRPTSLRLSLAGNDGQPKGTYPLNRCEGDCDLDSDCGPGLICYQREAGGQPVPGCLRGDKEKSATDYCVPEWATLPPTYFPTETPTGEPVPTWMPTESPTWFPTWSPTGTATYFPTEAPTGEPVPTWMPTESPTWSPTWSPTGTVTSAMERNFLREFSCNVMGLFCN